jgi:hypothetical protein
MSALATEQGYRVYLTGRDEQQRLQIGWLDLNHDLELVYEPHDNPALTPGRMGCFDCGGLCMPFVVRLTDSLLYMYYAGWGPPAIGIFQNQCGLAISRDDGATWERWSEAPLPLIDDIDPIGIGTVHVTREAADHWRMWYTSMREWRPLEDGKYRHYYHVRYAESEDGIHWRKPPDNVAADFIDEQEFAVARPMVLQEPDGYRMWLCTRREGETYRISYAESADGRRWERKPAGIGPSPSGWDSQMIEYAYVLPVGDRYLMFYNGNGYGDSGTGAAWGREV